MHVKKQFFLFFFLFGILATSNNKLFCTQEPEAKMPQTQAFDATTALHELLDCIAEEDALHRLNYAMDFRGEKKYQLFVTYFLAKNGQQEQYQKACRHLQKIDVKQLNEKDRKKLDKGIAAICNRCQDLLQEKTNAKLTQLQQRTTPKIYQLRPRIRGNSEKLRAPTRRKQETLVPHKPITPKMEPSATAFEETQEAPIFFTPTPPKPQRAIDEDKKDQQTTPREITPVTLDKTDSEDMPRGFTDETTPSEEFSFDNKSFSEDMPRGLTE